MIVYLGIAGWWDFAQRRVPNLLNLAAIALALFLAALRSAPFLVLSLKGMALGAGIGLVPFTLHMLGGGDVKSLMALGAFSGPVMVWSGFFGALMAGGVLGVLLLLPSLSSRPRPTIPFVTLLALSCYLQLIII
jgi:prepilin peptidase CpaA